MNVKIVCIGVTRDCYQCIIGNISFIQYVRIKPVQIITIFFTSNNYWMASTKRNFPICITN